MIEFLVFSLLNGLLYGMLLFMLSSGLTLIFSMMGVLNFAHASFYMLGAYFAFQISTWVGFWPGLIVAPLLIGVIGALVERFGESIPVLEIGGRVAFKGRLEAGGLERKFRRLAEAWLANADPGGGTGA